MDALTSEAAGKTIEVWFQDEARVGQQGTLSYVWAPIGSRPARVRDCRHASAYLFGAICPARAVGAAIVDACCDAWNGLMRDPERIASLTTRDWAQVGT